MQHDLSWADSCHREPFLGEIFAIAFVRGRDPLDALDRVGGLPDTVADRTPDEIRRLHEYEHGYPDVVSALALGEWTVLVQPTGFELAYLADALSRGTEALTVLRHDYANPRFTHALDGRIVTGFHPSWPGDRHGTDRDALVPRMRQAGFDLDGDGGQYDGAISRSLRLAGLVTGVLPTFEQLTAPLPSMHFDPWFARTRPSSVENERDALAKAEAIVAELDLAGTPGLADAFAAAHRGERVVVTQHSELGRHVREWSTTSRVGRWSANDHSAAAAVTDEDRHRGHRFTYLLEALRAAFRPDLA